MPMDPRATPKTRPGLDVLVVDDDRDTADTLVILLELWGHRPRAAYDADAAVRVVAEEPPHVVFLDLGLPGRDGFELAADLRAQPGMRDAVLFAVTGHTVLANRGRARDCGFADVLIKPVEPETLRTLLHGLQTNPRVPGTP
jgi:DNA-binding response OmpR family regulator